jgi:ketosteroid isomerase-like protein
VSHPNEDWLRELYARFAQGDLPAFLDACTDDVTFTVPGNATPSGEFDKSEFMDWIVGVLGATDGTFCEDVLDVFANDEHALLLLHHHFDRDGKHWEYETAHVCELRDGKIASWRDHPGSMQEFEDAWGRRA